jgi:hypothetical protein
MLKRSLRARRQFSPGSVRAIDHHGYRSIRHIAIAVGSQIQTHQISRLDHPRTRQTVYGFIIDADHQVPRISVHISRCGSRILGVQHLLADAIQFIRANAGPDQLR